MQLIIKKKLGKYLFWLGPVLIVMGLTAGVVSNNWMPIPLGLVILGIVLTGLWLIYQSQRSKWWKRRSTQAGANALVATLAVLVILGLVNFLGNRYQVRQDLTETGLFTLAPQSKELVQNLQTPVKVWVFDRNQNPLDRELLENYRRQGKLLSFEYIDPQARPGLTEKFGVKEFGEVYLEANNQRKLVQVVNDNERLSEVQLTNRLQQITGGSQNKVYFLQGHGELALSQGEGGLSQAVSTLGEKNYTAEPLNLIQKSSIPEDASVVVVASPKRGLFDSEVKALQEYLNRGGNLLLMIDPNTDPKLESLLKEWGVTLDNRLAVDVSGGVGLGPAVPLVSNYGNHPITKDFANGVSFYRLARPIQVAPVPGIEATPLLLTKQYPDSWAESDLQNENLQFNPESDRPGPLTLGVALSRKVQPKAEVQSSATPSVAPTPSPAASTATESKASPSPSVAPTPSPAASTATESKSSPTPSVAPTPSPAASTTTESKASPTPSVAPTPSPAASTATESKASPSPSVAPTNSIDNKSQPTPSESRLVVLGNSDFATNGLFEQQLNGDVFLNSVSWLSQQDTQTLSIRPKEAKNRRINMTPIQATILGWSALLVLPLLSFGAAGIIWWQRR